MPRIPINPQIGRSVVNKSVKVSSDALIEFLDSESKKRQSVIIEAVTPKVRSGFRGTILGGKKASLPTPKRTKAVESVLAGSPRKLGNLGVADLAPLVSALKKIGALDISPIAIADAVHAKVSPEQLRTVLSWPMVAVVRPNADRVTRRKA